MFSFASDCSLGKGNSETISITVMILINTNLIFGNSIEVRGKCAKFGYGVSFFSCKAVK